MNIYSAGGKQTDGVYIGGGFSNVLFSFIYLFQAFIFIFIYLFLSVISESLTWDRHGEESQMSTMMGTT